MLELVGLSSVATWLAGYGAGLLRLRRRGVRWPAGRTVALVAGLACVAAGVLPPVVDHDETFWVHVGQHLLLAMAAPVLLALSGPFTLALRTLPRRSRRLILGALHSTPVAFVTTPALVLLLDICGLVLLYTTGTYALTLQHDGLHALVHLHMFLTGCLLAWVVVGVDPMPRRPGFGGRLATLVIVAAAHDTISKLLYAHDLPVGAGPASDRHAGAQLMYYGGTVVDLAMAVALMGQWYRATGREHRRMLRRAGPGGPPGPSGAAARDGAVR